MVSDAIFASPEGFSVDKVHAKWGFGNAPLKDGHRAKTEAAIQNVIAVLESPPTQATAEQLDAISHVKGQFTRTLKQDQWDWSTVWALLGRPSRQPANRISKTLRDLRTALKEGDSRAAEHVASRLLATGLLRYLDNFLAGGRDLPQQAGTHGFLYILATRNHPQLLKVGITQRTVQVRVKEINSATGVAIPYGVRAVWRVDNASVVEMEIHALLAPFRVRADREFFEVDFFEASRLINDHLGARRILKSSTGARRGAT